MRTKAEILKRLAKLKRESQKAEQTFSEDYTYLSIIELLWVLGDTETVATEKAILGDDRLE